MNYEQAIKDLQDTLVVISEIERRQSKLLREHAQLLSDHDSQLAEMQEYRRRTERNLAEITDKLNGLIGWADGWQPPQRPA